MRKLVQGSVRVFPISIMKKHSPKQNNYFSVSWKARKTKGTQLTKSDMQWGRRHTLMCRFKNFLLHTKINCYTCLTLHTLFIEPWLMNNKQRVYPTEAWKYHFMNSWTICLIYTWFCNVYVSFLFFDASHWPRIWHSTIGGGGWRSIWYTHQLQIWRQSEINHLKTRNSRKMSLLVSRQLIAQ